MSPAEELRFLIKNYPHLRCLARHYRNKVGNRLPDDYEDLLQEACCALLTRLRSAKDADDAEKYAMQVLHSMHEHSRRMAPIHFSEKRFSEGIRNVKTVRWQFVNESALVESFEDSVIDSIDAHRFLESLDPLERRVVTLKMKGHTQREIAKICGVGSESRISRMFDRIGDKYLASHPEYRRTV